jgi:hypothetical protein
VIRFQLADGSIVEAVKDCLCRTHEGPCWLHASDLWRARVDALYAAGNIRGYIHEGYLQARNLRLEMQNLGIVKILRGNP